MRDSLPNHGFDRCDGHHEMVDCGWHRAGPRPAASGVPLRRFAGCDRSRLVAISVFILFSSFQSSDNREHSLPSDQCLLFAGDQGCVCSVSGCEITSVGARHALRPVDGNGADDRPAAVPAPRRGHPDINAGLGATSSTPSLHCAHVIRPSS